MTDRQHDLFRDVAVERWDPPRNGSFVSFWRNLVIVVTIGTAGFVIGVNWHRVDELTGRFEAHVAAEDRANETFANKDTVEEHFRSVQRQLEDLKALIVAQRRDGIR